MKRCSGGKAQFLPAYHCSISSSMLPEIDGERSWTEKPLTAPPPHITVSWRGPQAGLNSTCFYDKQVGGSERWAWHWVWINSGAGNISLSHCFLHIARLSLCVSVIFWSQSHSHLDFPLVGKIYYTPSRCLWSVLPSHPWVKLAGLDQVKNNKISDFTLQNLNLSKRTEEFGCKRCQ